MIKKIGFLNSYNIIFKLLFFKRDVIIRIYKNNFELRANTGDLYMFFQTFINQEYKIDNDILKKINIKYIIDGGANIGDSAIFFNKQFPNAIIDAIELERKIFIQLENNTKNYNNIKIHKKALWHTSNLNLNIYDFGEGDCAYTISELDDQKHKKIIDSVKTITIQDLLKNSGYQYIDILKLDIEGAEKEIFEDENCKHWINKTNIIIIELHDRMKKGCRKSFYGSVCHENFYQIVNGENIFLIRNDFLKNE